jgi:hypothetical protein
VDSGSGGDAGSNSRRQPARRRRTPPHDHATRHARRSRGPDLTRGNRALIARGHGAAAPNARRSAEPVHPYTYGWPGYGYSYGPGYGYGYGYGAAGQAVYNWGTGANMRNYVAGVNAANANQQRANYQAQRQYEKYQKALKQAQAQQAAYAKQQEQLMQKYLAAEQAEIQKQQGGAH